MSSQFFGGNFTHVVAAASIPDTTAPTFAGITFLDVESRGQIRAGWSAATDASTPIRYEIYIKASTATGLFNVSNIVALTPNVQYDIFTMPDGSFLVNGTTYYVGVRAIDAYSNRDSNTVSLDVISTGVLTAIDVYNTQGSFSVNNSNQFCGTLWANKNSGLAVSPAAVLGTASYAIYDKSGNAVVGMSQSGITANSQGLFVITPVSNLLTLGLNNYEVQVTISVDGEARTNFIPLMEDAPKYEIDGVVDINEASLVNFSFWVKRDESVVLPANLGAGSFVLYDVDGIAVSGGSQSGITALSNGMFVASGFSLPVNSDPRAAYAFSVSLVVDGKTKTAIIPLDSKIADISPKAQFSINALNQFQGTFWATIAGDIADTALLGDASYEVYDTFGTPVVGLSQTGISPDSNGLYHITPVSAALISDLTHYTVKIVIEVVGSNHSAYKGFTLLGT